MICLNTRKALYTLLGGVIVMAAETIKNTQEQLTDYRENKQIEEPNRGMLDNISPILYAFGWLIVSYAIASDSEGRLSMQPKTYLSFATAAGIVMSVMQMKKLMKDTDREIPIHLPLIFSGCWLILGYAAGMGRPGINRLLGLLAAGMVISSVFVMLPWQREKQVVDGPGKDLFTMAWGALTLANSIIIN